MEKAIYHAALILKLNERLFINCLAEVTEEQATTRISDHNNSLIWIATHTIWARYNTAALLGKPTDNPYKGMFENFKAYETSMVLPNLETVKVEWQKASDLINVGLASITEAQLRADAPFKSPAGDYTIGGTIAFLAQHESYDIGQMALLKKYLTKTAMSYN